MTMLKINFPGARRTVLVVLGATLLFAAGYGLGFKGFIIEFNKFPKTVISRVTPPDKSEVNFSLFWQVWDNLNAGYFDKTKLNPAGMIYGAISGMVAAVGDPYTSFLPPAENKIVNEDLNGFFEGVGVQIGFRGTQLVAIAALPGSPAETAGVKSGDFIVGIKDDARKLDRGTVGITLQEAVQAIRGPAGTKVSLMLVRDGSSKAFVVEMARVKMDVPSLILKFLDEKAGVPAGQKIAQIQLLKFGGETATEWENAVREILKDGSVSGVILDLRSNPGGFMQGAVDTAAEFLPNGSLVVIEERAGKVRTEYKTSRLGLLTKVPLAVLINGGSASASEILAGALRDDAEIKLIGEKTFGKGTIQEPQDLAGGAGLHITVAKWLTPKGTWVNEKGLEPDVKIEDDVKTPEDEQLKAALKVILR